ncbi:phage tail length tape measure family protein [Mesorhizobium muleiense]|uniref:phage tail length tape measure family protein n=1 Tax=Mesorhizobium muleiense TaxID=1004279 RepID=UPI001F1ED7C3|nr:phage tail length tape measure family protein [Mesorhizobium muleiense]MCF6112003.1 phage tail length tape measure family protein [Mesorhizobium muleiense]
MAGDTEDLILSISADTKQIQRALQRLTGDTKTTTTAIQQQFDQLGNRTAGAFDGTAARAKRSFTVIEGGARDSAKTIQTAMKASSFQTANLGAQLQDIAVQLQSGASPLTIALQQGTQINQVLGQAGAGGAVRALGGAFASMVNPVSLATIAIIGLGGAAVQYFMNLLSDSEDAEKTLKEQAELIGKVADKWGDALPALKAYNDERKKLADEQDIKGAVDAAVAGEYEPLRAKIKDINIELVDLLAKLQASGTSDTGIVKLQQAFGGLLADIEKNDASVERLKSVQAALSDLYLQTHIPAAKQMADAIGGIADELERTVAAGQKLRADDALREFYKNAPLGTLSPLTSGGGSFLNPAELLDFQANEATYAEAGASAAAAMIRGFESFAAKAYPDKRASTGEFDAWRVGFGSDTVTRANGVIEKVTQQTVVTLDDAQRDLSRRILEFQSGIQDAIGSDSWRSLNDAQQAALTSIAYNYGQLPKSIVAAIKSGGGPEVVAAAIAELSANPKRRKDEAQAYLTGTGVSMSEAGLGASKRTPDDIFKGSLEDIQRRIDLLNAEAEALASVNPSINDYGYALDKARIKQQLLNDAAQAGVAITPELAQKIDELAGNYASASSSADQFKASQQGIAENQQEINEIGRGILGGIIDDLRAGKDAGEIFANVLSKISDRLQDMLLNMLFPTSGGGGLLGGIAGGGGLLGGLIIPGILHSGGVAGVDGYGHTRKVSSATFAGAQRYHSGGVAGLKPDEVPAILQKGEIILPKGKNAGGGSNVHVTVGVSADNNGNLLPFVESVSERKAGQVSTATIKQYDKGFASRVGDVMERNG